MTKSFMATLESLPIKGYRSRNFPDTNSLRHTAEYFTIH